MPRWENRPLTEEQRNIAECHFGLARSVANTYPKRARDRILSAAMLGLCYAARQYVPGEVPFPAYARIRMRQPTADTLDEISEIRPSSNARRKDERNRAAREAREKLLAMTPHPPDNLPDHRSGGIESDMAIDIADAIATLPERQREAMQILCRGGDQGDLSRELGIGESSAWRLRNRAFERLRSILSSYEEAS